MSNKTQAAKSAAPTPTKASNASASVTTQADVNAQPNAKLQKRLSAIFKANPLLKAVYQTADGYLFNQKGLAKTHAKTLKNKAVTLLQKQ